MNPETVIIIKATDIKAPGNLQGTSSSIENLKDQKDFERAPLHRSLNFIIWLLRIPVDGRTFHYIMQLCKSRDGQ